MLLENEAKLKYLPEIKKLYTHELGEPPVAGLIYFGTFLENSEQTLKAVASLKNYMGSWYLRGCVVKPEYRGQGLQQILIEERLAYLTNRTNIARVSVFPENTYSIKNIEAGGFTFERKKKLEGGHRVLVYKYSW
jgi:ribosomal protein S18 acetylase RimI-like enzyme